MDGVLATDVDRLEGWEEQTACEESEVADSPLPQEAGLI
jgi:hypothetical protein